MNYNCDACNYSTDVKFCFQKHLNTQKHKEKVKELERNLTDTSQEHQKSDVRICCFCDQEYANASSLAKHRRVCGSKKELENTICKLNNTINCLKKDHHKEIKNLKYAHTKEVETFKEIIEDIKESMNNELESYRERIEDFKENRDITKQLIGDTGKIVKNSTSALKYISANYKTAPVLAPLADYALVTYNKDIHTKPAHKHDKRSATDRFIDHLIFYYNEKSLDKYFGDIIVENYKKKNPFDQSIWNSDTNRLSYIIMTLIEEGKMQWRADKKGILTTEYIVKPLTDHVATFLEKHMQDYTDVDMSLPFKVLEKNHQRLFTMAGLLQMIKSKEFADNILKYIAPYFFHKDQPMIEA